MDPLLPERLQRAARSEAFRPDSPDAASGQLDAGFRFAAQSRDTPGGFTKKQFVLPMRYVNLPRVEFDTP